MVYNGVHTSQQTLEGKSIFNQHLCIPLSSHQEEKDVIYFLLYIVLIVWSPHIFSLMVMKHNILELALRNDDRIYLTKKSIPMLKI